MKKCWRNESGSTLLLILAAITVSALLFGAIYAAANTFHKRTLTNDLHLQAEYNAEKMMELATYYYYKDITTFGLKVGDCASNVSYVDPDGTGSSVCLSNNLTLVATGTAKGTYQSALQQTVTIKVDLTQLSAPGGFPGGDDGGDSGGGWWTWWWWFWTWLQQFWHSFGGHSVTANQANSTSNSASANDLQANLASESQGEPCSGSSASIPMRALSMGTDFHTESVLKDNSAINLNVQGGTYIGNGGSIWMDHDHKTVNLNGLNFAEGGLQWSQGNGNNSPSYASLGDHSTEDTSCTGLQNYHGAMIALANHVLTNLTQVPVYQFDGTRTGGVHLSTKGYKRPSNMSNFDLSNSYTLEQVLASNESKIVLIKGDLVLDQDTNNSPVTNLSANGYLIVYNPNDGGSMSTLYLPDNVNLQVQGALAFEQIGEIKTDPVTHAYSLTSRVWPGNSTFNLQLSAPMEALYRQF